MSDRSDSNQVWVRGSSGELRRLTDMKLHICAVDFIDADTLVFAAGQVSAG